MAAVIQKLQDTVEAQRAADKAAKDAAAAGAEGEEEQGEEEEAGGEEAGGEEGPEDAAETPVGAPAAAATTTEAPTDTEAPNQGVLVQVFAHVFWCVAVHIGWPSSHNLCCFVTRHIPCTPTATCSSTASSTGTTCCCICHQYVDMHDLLLYTICLGTACTQMLLCAPCLPVVSLCDERSSIVATVCSIVYAQRMSVYTVSTS